jgi:hypothetical protein
MAIQFFGLDTSSPPPPGSTVWLEAERGTVGANWNDNVADSTASSGQLHRLAERPEPEQRADDYQPGWDTTAIQRAVAGTYNVWFRKKTPTADDDSFWLRTDNGGWTLWNNMGSSSSWVWVKAPVTYNLSAGGHTFYVGLRENGSQLDKVYLTTGNEAPTGQAGHRAIDAYRGPRSQAIHLPVHPRNSRRSARCSDSRSRRL